MKTIFSKIGMLVVLGLLLGLALVGRYVARAQNHPRLPVFADESVDIETGEPLRFQQYVLPSTKREVNQKIFHALVSHQGITLTAEELATIPFNTHQIYDITPSAKHAGYHVHGVVKRNDQMDADGTR